LRQQRFEPEKARAALGLVASEHAEPMLPFRYRVLALWGYDEQETEALTEAQVCHFLRMDRVQARQELDRLRLMTDRPGNDGFEPFGMNPEEVLVPA
jgi:hypothetical protein